MSLQPQVPPTREKSPLNSERHELQSLLVKKRGTIKGRLTKFSNYVISFDVKSSTPQNLLDLKLRIKGATNLYREFNEIQSSIEEIVSDAGQDEQLNERVSFEDNYYSTLAQAEYLLSNDRVTESSKCTNNNNQLQSIKLPTISMPTFNGSSEHWLEFRDTFMSLVHNSNDISNIQKFHYLKSSLKGDAQVVIDALEFSADNYNIAWDSLLNRYDNSRILVQNHIKAIFNIQPILKESPTLIKKLIDTILKNLRALKILGEPTEHWDTLIIYIIVTKLDKITERDWEGFKGSLVDNENTKRKAKVSDLVSFLQNKADMLDTLQLSHSKDMHDFKKLSTSHCHISSQSSSSKSQNKQHVKRTCPMCNATHPLYSCLKFINSDLAVKLKLIKDHNLCENCLRSGHTLENCNYGPCRKCNKKHNSLIHNDSLDSNSNFVALHTSFDNAKTFCNISNATCPSKNVGISESLISDVNTDVSAIQVNKTHVGDEYAQSSLCQPVLLSTALVEVADTQGTYHLARALLDSGSQRCFISKSFSNIINANYIQSTHEIRGVGNSVIQCTQTCTIELKSHVTTYTTRIRCFVLNKITSTLPAISNSYAQFCPPDNIQLADPQFLNANDVDILIGADKFWDLISDGKMRLPNGPFLQNTKLGWIISGPILNKFTNTHNSHIQCNFSSSIDLQLRKFWELEDLPKVTGEHTEQEIMCENHFIKHTTRNQDGRFIVSMPFSQSPDVLGESYSQAKRRFLTLERRLGSSPELKKLYTDFIHEYLSLGHMSKVTTKYSQPHYIIPHLGVMRESSTTTKLRTVFDASTKTSSGKSLNDIQLVGPAIQGDLFAILLRFRQYRYVACADIEKMYRQVLINENQRDLQLILWRDDPSDPLDTYRLHTVTYGMAIAPFLSVRCIKQVGIECSDLEVKRILNDDFYVDDMLTGDASKDKLLELCQKTASVLQKACFPLRKWVYNFDHKNRLEFDRELSLSDNCNSKTLGVGWNNFNDIFYYNTQFKNENKIITKRSILSNVSQIFDPLGLLSPFITIAKVLLQQLWLIKSDWDDAVPDDVARSWHRFADSLSSISSIRIPRHVIGSNPQYLEMHIFVDASQTAYGSCIYIRTVGSDLGITMRLLCSKAKVAPIKPISIPRLELCAALLGARLYSKVISCLRCTFSKIIFWTDSTIVLGWLRMTPNRLKTFVQSRVAEIHELCKELPWFHVISKNNSADILSRGANLKDLEASSLWWSGPDFLKDPNFRYESVRKSYDYDPSTLPELRNTTMLFHAGGDVSDSPECVFPFKRFSQYNRMQRAVAYLLRFIHNARSKVIHKDKRVGMLSVDELKSAEITLARWAQVEAFPNEFALLSNDRALKSKNRFSNLNIFFDTTSRLLRVGGRIEYSEQFSYDKKHPILLSSKHYFSHLLFRYKHRELLHAAPQALLFNLREYWWPINGRNLSKKVVHECVTCTRIKGKTLTTLMGNLPKQRVSATYPFYRCGVDYAGPMLIINRKGRGAKTVKVYICLFVCFITRAIHLELVSDLSTDSYLLSLKRFISRRGKPSEIFSDNCSNFVGLKNDFAKFISTCSADIVEYATSQQIKFSFIPPYSPHFGGLWEAGVKSCKHHLRRVVGNSHLTYEELNTVLTEIEAVLNSRPLTPMSADPCDFLPLSPGHFLVGRPLTAPACDDLTEEQPNRLNRYQRVEQIRQHFWARWSKEFISELQTRVKWTRNEAELKPNTFVVIKQDNLPPLKWMLGRIVKTIPGKDGVCRVADIQTSSGIVRRAYAKICPLFDDNIVKDAEKNLHIGQPVPAAKAGGMLSHGVSSI